MSDEGNPYASPAETPRQDRPEKVGDGVLLRSGLLFRRIWLPPPVSAVLEYNALTVGYDLVRVAGRVLVRRWCWLWFVPRFDFQAPMRDGGSLPATLVVEIDLLLRVRRIEIVIDGQLVYSEQR